MAKLSSDETSAMWEAQGHCCGICGGLLDPAQRYLEGPYFGAWTIEHVYPRTAKRYHHDGNKLVTHYGCNQKKGDRPPTGCEILTLAKVNAVLGKQLVERIREYREEPKNEAMRLAMIEAGLIVPSTENEERRIA